MADATDYVLPNAGRLAILAAVILLANTPYLGTTVKGESRCFEKQCSDAYDSSCIAGPQCYARYEARPSWIFWWPYPEFTMEYDKSEFSSQAIPLLQITSRSNAYHQDGLVATIAYWYALVLAMTLPFSGFGKKWYQKREGDEPEQG